jgi:hypothetical protein
LNLDNNNFIDILLTNSFNGLTDLETLSLQNNQISKFHQEMPTSTLRELKLRHNKISKFFVGNFISNTKSSHLNIQIGNNVLESIDFNAVDEKLNLSNLTLTLDVGATPINCNCHTLSLYEFLTGKSFNGIETYDKIEIIPHEIYCIANEHDEVPIEIKEIDTNKMICSLDNDHQNLCPKNCTCYTVSFQKKI